MRLRMLPGDPFRLLENRLWKRPVHLDRRPVHVALVGDQDELAALALVVRDESVRARENLRRVAVVADETYDRRVGVFLLELDHEPHVGEAESVDHLPVVTDGHGFRFRGQLAERGPPDQQPQRNWLIQQTVRVICRVNFKTVKMYENSVVQSLIKSYRQGWTVNLFPQTLNLIIDLGCEVCGMWFTVKGRPLWKSQSP